MLIRFLCVIISSLLLCSCAKNNIEELTFSSWGSVTETKILNTIIKDYEKENPNIKIKFIHIPQNYFQKIHLLFASSTEPNVIFINNLYLPVYENFLEPLDEIIDKEEYYKKSIEVLSINDKLLAVPRDISNFVFYYNKNILGEIKPDWTFEEFSNLIKKNTTKDHFSVSYERDIFQASPYTLTLGFDKGIEFYKNLEGKYAPTPASVGSMTLAQLFLKGKLGLYLSGRWMYPKIKENATFPFGIVAFPGKVSADASGWAISKRSKHKEAAKNFVKYLASRKSIDYFVSTGLIIPARKDSAESITDRAFIDAISKSVVVKTDKNYNKLRDKYNKLIFDNF